MKILFIGGNGNISWHCVNEAIKAGHEVFTLNRSLTVSSRRPPHPSAKHIKLDIRNSFEVKRSLSDNLFDVVCDFICYNDAHAQAAIDIFSEITKQYIFISSTAVYDRKKSSYPLREDAPRQSDWLYAENKIAAERFFLDEHDRYGFPVTIVRPGQVYDTLIPDAVGNADWTVAKRMLEGKPIILFGDGTTLWTLTHASDFAAAFTHLLGNVNAIGQAYHIASDEWLTWRQITEITANALGVKPKIVYIPTDFIEKILPELAAGITGHKVWCDIYDNTKIKNSAPGWKCELQYEDGIKKSLEWLRKKDAHRRVNKKLNEDIDTLIRVFTK